MIEGRGERRQDDGMSTGAMKYPDPISVEEYLEGDKISEIRHEFVGG